MKLLLLQNESVDQPTLVKTVEINDDDHLKDYYHYLNCRCIDMQEITIDNHHYDIIFDDEFLLIEKPIPTLYVNEHTVIFNNVLFARHDDEGATIGLENDDIGRICIWLASNEKRLRQWFLKMISSRK
jgi:hypothetical protein